MRTPSSTIKSEDELVCRNNNRHYQVRKTRIDMPFLPEEIIYKILLLFPAKVLHGVMRTVCRLWRKVIQDPVFIKTHGSCSTNSPFCILIHDYFFEIYSLKNDEITWKFSKWIDQRYLTHGDGFILTSNRSDPWILSLINPLTKQIISLPRFSISFWPRPENCTVSCSPFTLKYKVVILRWPNYIIALDVENFVFHNIIIPKEFKRLDWVMCSDTSFVMDYCRSNSDRRDGGEWRKFGTVDIESRMQKIKKIMGVHRRIKICAWHITPVLILSRDVVIFRRSYVKSVYILY